MARMSRYLLLFSLAAEQSFKEGGGKANSLLSKEVTRCTQHQQAIGVRSHFLKVPIPPLDSVVYTELSYSVDRTFGSV